MKSSLRFRHVFVILLGIACLFSCEKPGPDPEPVPPEPPVELSLSLEKLTFSAYGGSREATVTTNQTEWTATVPDTDAAWLSVSVNGSSVTVSVQENTGDKERSGKVIVSAGSKKVEVPVDQDAAAGIPAGCENAKVTYNLKEGTVVAPKSFVSYIKAHDADARTFTVGKDIAAEMLPTPGTNLIINTPTSALPGGLLAYIESVEETANGYLVSYHQVNVTAVFKDLDLDTDEVDLGAYVTRIEDAEGNEVPFTKTKAAAQQKYHIDLPQVGWDLPLGLSITPKMGLDIGLKMQMIVGDYKISTFNYKVDMDAEIGADLELSYDASFDKYFKILTLYFAAIPVGPVVLTPGIDLYGVIRLDGKIALSASVSTVLHTSGELHYDEINGLSGGTSAEDPEPGETKYSLGPKIEAGVSYGLGIGPSIGVYTDIIQAGITMNVRRHEAMSTSIDLISLFSDPDAAWMKQTYCNASYSINWEIDAALHLRAMGVTKDFSAPSIGLGGKTYKMFPPFDLNLEVDPVGNGFVIKTCVTEPSMLAGYPGADGGELVLQILEQWNTELPMYYSFDWSKEKSDALWEDPSVPQNIEASISGLTAGRRYYAYVCWKLGNNTIPFLALGDFIALDTKTQNAIRGILSDVKSCAASDWEGCNWDEDLPVTKYKNVRIRAGDSGNSTVCLSIELPEDWKLGKNLIVKNHSAGLNDSQFSWSLQTSDLEYDTISIDDVCFSSITSTKTGGHSAMREMKTKTFICHSPQSWDYPDTVTEKLDLSGSGAPSLVLYNSIPEITVDDCPKLYNITIIPTDDGSVNSFSAKNCPAVEILELNGDINVSAAQIQDMIGTVAAAGKSMDLELSLDAARMMGDLTIGKGVSRIQLKNIQSLSLSDASDLERVFLESKITNLSISNCAKLIALNSGHVGLESFSISGTPVLDVLRIADNHSLTMVVPSVFEQIRNAGGTLVYDIRYEYRGRSSYDTDNSSFVDSEGKTWIRYVWGHDDYGEDFYFWYHDNGYGFYYSDEPGRSYHDDASSRLRWD